MAAAMSARGTRTHDAPVGRTDDALVEAWRGLLDQHARAHCALERALKSHDLGVSEYEVLERLAADPPDEKRRMQDLAEAVHLSQSALSRVVGRLEQDGLAGRGICPQDRRGIYVWITDASRQRYETAEADARKAEAALAKAKAAGMNAVLLTL
jgi:DNA-binding MarR family transcriptional regulator